MGERWQAFIRARHRARVLRLVTVLDDAVEELRRWGFGDSPSERRRKHQRLDDLAANINRHAGELGFAPITIDHDKGGRHASARWTSDVRAALNGLGSWETPDAR